MRLENRIAVITGAASGIGRQTAIRFVQEGAMVVLADRDSSSLADVENEIRKFGGECLTFHVDVSNKESIEQMFNDVREKWRKIDILINNAGITADAQLVKMTERAFDDVIDVNLKGVYLCGQAAARIMTETGGGVILNASSIVGLYGNFGQTNYAASKWGVIGMTRTWARELGKKGIRVNAVAPGFIKTPMTENMPAEILDTLLERSPLKRLGDPEDIANAYLFLASDEAKFITGSVLSVDGGMVI